MNNERPMLRPLLACAIVAGFLTTGLLGCDGLLGVDFGDARPPSAADDAGTARPDAGADASEASKYLLVTLDETPGRLPEDAVPGPIPIAPAVVISVDAFASSPLEPALAAGECLAESAPKVPASPLEGPPVTVSVSKNISSDDTSWPPIGIPVDRGSPFEAGNTGWTSSAYITVDTAQGEPVFYRPNIEAPPNIDVTTPELASDGALTVDRTVALLTKWTGGGPGRVEVTLTSSEPAASRQTIVRCSFRARDNQGSVPSKLLALLQQAAAPGITGTYSIRPTNLVEFGASGWTVGVALNAVRKSGPLRISK